MIQQFKNYTRVAPVGHSKEDLATYRERALRVADYCKRWNLTCHEMRGSDDHVR